MNPTPSAPLNKAAIYLSLFLLSAAALTFEINLTRLFSVAQFYHFAFMIVSVALLGYGASGTFLTIFPKLQHARPQFTCGWLSVATSLSILAAYLLTNWLPFDSYSLLVDDRQIFILACHYLTLAVPFFFTGMALGWLLAKFPAQAGSTYSVNLFGSAFGCILALLLPSFLGGEGMVTLSALLALLAAISATRLHPLRHPLSLGAIGLLTLCLIDLSLRLITQAGLPTFNLHISPYKSLSYALQYPGSKVTFRQWNAFSRLDVVQSQGLHSIPGLSYRYLQTLPTLQGLFVDGDDLAPVIQPSTDPSFTAYLPATLAFQLQPHANTLVLEPRGGLDILTALTQSTGKLTAVESNPLIVKALPVYADARLYLHQETMRSFLERSPQQFEVILLSLISSFHPVQSGAYTLVEDYRYTLESFSSMLDHLSPGGVLLATRWLQDPPSEDLRLFALAVEAVEAAGGDPRQQIVAFRGYNSATILVKNGVFTPGELNTLRNFTSKLAFDLTYAPGIQEAETNRYNILPDTRYYRTYLDLLEAAPRQAFYDSYGYNVRPPTDDHPFFGHYFKWAQVPQIVEQFGKAWLPFGGGGYLVILVLLCLAVLLAGFLIFLPVGIWKLNKRATHPADTPFKISYLVYFGLLGLAFLFVEIPLLQRFILYLGNPAYAVTAVLFALLLFSGLGSRFAANLSLPTCLAALTLCLLGMPVLLPLLFDWTLGFPLAARLGITLITLSPLGFLMGIPFPGGILHLLGGFDQPASLDAETAPRSDVPWIWAVNGSASVISPILAALLAITFSFRVVFWLGALCYGLALVTVWVYLHRRTLVRPFR